MRIGSPLGFAFDIGVSVLVIPMEALYLLRLYICWVFALVAMLFCERRFGWTVVLDVHCYLLLPVEV